MIYDDIYNGENDIPEELNKDPNEHDSDIVEDLAKNFAISELYNQEANFDEVQENKIAELKEKLHFKYNKYGERIDPGYLQERSKNVLENITWKEEISLVKEKDKIDALMDIKKMDFMIDKLSFIDNTNAPITCLSVEIVGINNVSDKDGSDESRAPCITAFSEFVLNATGSLMYGEEDMSWEIDVDQIKEIIINDTKYTFLF